MKQWFFLALLILASPLRANNEHQPHDHSNTKNKLILALVAVGCVIAKPSILLIPFKALLLPFKLIASLGTIALFAIPAVIAAGVVLAYPQWKKHKKDILAQWNKHKHLITAHAAALAERGKNAWHHLNQHKKTQPQRLQLPPDISLLPDYRA
jgi:hypothetical protein